MKRQLMYSALGVVGMACTPRVSVEQQLEELGQAAPWMSQFLEACESYKTAEWDAEKQDLAAHSKDLLSSAKVQGARAYVERVVPIAAGKEYALQLKVGNDVWFSSQSGRRPIRQGDAFFDFVAALSTRDCVTFAGENVEPVADYQEGKVCTPRFYVRFTEIGSCP